MLKAEPVSGLWVPLTVLAVMAAVVLGLAVLRFRRDLAPNTRHARVDDPGLPEAA